MEQNKSNNKVIFFLVMVIICLLIGGGFLIKIMFFDGPVSGVVDSESSNSQLSGENSSNNDDVDINNQNNTKYGYTVTKRKILQELELSGSGNSLHIIVDKKGNAYFTYYGDTDNASSGIKKIIKNFKTYSPEGYYYGFGETGFSGYKFNVSKVLSAYEVIIGNGGLKCIIFVRENGVLSYLNYTVLLNDGKVVLEDVKGLKNIVTIVSNHSMPYAVDTNGNEYYLSDYMNPSYEG